MVNRGVMRQYLAAMAGKEIYKMYLRIIVMAIIYIGCMSFSDNNI